MNKINSIRPEFVDRIPKVLDNGVVYVSRKYATAAHNCCCGCGTKIVTPLKPGRWRLETQSESISIYPSIGNWSAGCQSHYFIRDNHIDWALGFTPAQIAANRASDERARHQAHTERYQRERGFWGRLWDGIQAAWQAFKGWFC